MTCWTEIPDLGDLSRYLKAIEKFPMLTLEEETNCVNEGEHGKAKLVLSHLRLGAKLARQYIGFGFGHDELIQEATIGLLKAARVFDPTKARFATVATMWIRSELAEFTVKNRRIVKMATTKAQRKLFFNLNRIRNEKLRGSGRRSFSTNELEEIASTLEVKVEEIKEMDTRLRGGDVALDPLIESEEDEARASFGSYLTDHSTDPLRVLMKAERNWIETSGMEEALGCLSDREQFIVKHRHMVEPEKQLTLHDLAAIYGVSAERIRQLEVKAFKTMRKHLEVYA